MSACYLWKNKCEAQFAYDDAIRRGDSRFISRYWSELEMFGVEVDSVLYYDLAVRSQDYWGMTASCDLLTRCGLEIPYQQCYDWAADAHDYEYILCTHNSLLEENGVVIQYQSIYDWLVSNQSVEIPHCAEIPDLWWMPHRGYKFIMHNHYVFDGHGVQIDYQGIYDWAMEQHDYMFLLAYRDAFTEHGVAVYHDAIRQWAVDAGNDFLCDLDPISVRCLCAQ